MTTSQIRFISFLAFAVLIACTCAVFGDHLINRTPEVQSLVTGTIADVQGTVTEADSGAWITRDNLYFDIYGFDLPSQGYGVGPGGLTDPLLGDQAIISTGYNDNIAAVSGQTTIAKSMAITTANQIADGSNVKVATNLQFIATDTGRATRSEDLMVDDAANETDPASIYILCPFGFPTFNDDAIPAHCNIVQAGSAFDTTLTSTVTSADTRFAGIDSTIPVVLNYNINAQGITLPGISSPMIGSASAFLKVHTQEARQTNQSDVANYSVSWTKKAQDLVYSEYSSATGLITGFDKGMHYQSGFNLI